jgi:fucose permease
VVHVGMGLTGVVTTLLGPLLPFLAARWDLADSQAGGLFSAQFGGTLCGVALSGRLLRARGFVPTITLGLGLASAGIGALSVVGFGPGLAAIFAFGIGLGFTGPGFNIWIAEMHPHRRAAALALLNMAWALGATCAPTIVALLVGRERLTSFLPGLALVLAVIALLLGLGARKVARSQPVLEPAAGEALPPGFWFGRRPVLFAVLFFVYMGVEHALGGWVAMTARRLAVDAGGSAAAMPSFFWGALVLGRGSVPLLLRRFDETRVGYGALLAAATGTAGLLTADTSLGIAVSVALAGAGLAPVFPVTMALLSQTFGARAASVAGPMFGLGAFGGAVVPWLVGLISSRTGSLRAGLGVTLAGVLVLVACHRALHRRPA